MNLQSAAQLLLKDSLLPDLPVPDAPSYEFSSAQRHWLFNRFAALVQRQLASNTKPGDPRHPVVLRNIAALARCMSDKASIQEALESYWRLAQFLAGQGRHWRIVDVDCGKALQQVFFSDFPRYVGVEQNRSSGAETFLMQAEVLHGDFLNLVKAGRIAIDDATVLIVPFKFSLRANEELRKVLSPMTQLIVL